MQYVWLLSWDTHSECAFPSSEKAVDYVYKLYAEQNQKVRMRIGGDNRVAFEIMDGGEWKKSDAKVKRIPLYV